jgi:cell wall-associated NlpC family hydrolase
MPKFAEKITLLKPLFSLFVLLLFFTACKPTSAIITSKKVAENKGVYVAPIAKKNSVKKEKLVQKEIEKPSPNKNIISDTEATDYDINTDSTSYLVEQLILAAKENIGVRYKSGGITSEGFDCSGLMYNIFDLYHIKLPHSSSDQAKLGQVVALENAKKGDLIFFKTNGHRQISHVGMVVEITDSDIKFIHSSTSSGVIISSTNEAYYKRTFVQVNRVLE